MRQCGRPARGLGVIVLSLALAPSQGVLRAECPKLYPPDPDVEHFGRTLGQWHGDWWAWALAIPTDRNPIADLDGTDCHEGQSGDVFFLAGNFGGTSERTCTVPCGKAIFFPIITDIEWAPTALCNDCSTCRGKARDVMDSTAFADCEVDGCSLEGLEAYRLPSPPECFEFTVPPDNIFGLAEGTYKPAACDGFCILLEPLPPGEHTVHFKGAITVPAPFSLELTYHLTVEPCSGFRRGDADSNGDFNITDSIFILNALFQGGAQPACPDAADSDDNASVNITDAVFILNALFQGGSQPPAPGTSTCGSDPTADDLGCESSCS